MRKITITVDISIHALLAESDLTSVVSSAGTTDFYPRSPCGERPCRMKLVKTDTGISIHALLAESDGSWLARLASCSYFYPRSPCGERHLATRKPNYVCHFYPRSPCGERQRAEHHASNQQEFLSTLSLRRATLFNTMQVVVVVIFLSTLSLRRATEQAPYKVLETQISIHALLAESDRL